MSTGFGANLLSDIVSNAFCIGVPLLVVFGAYYLRGRRQLRRFFGITERRGGTVQIRLSNVYVKPAGSLSPVSIGDGYAGPALIAAEYRHAIELVSAIQSRPSAAAVYALAEQFGVKAVDRPVVCRVSPSLDYVRTAINEHRPVNFEGDEALVGDIRRTLVTHETFVLVGSPVYNVLTHYVLAHGGDQSRVRFVEAPNEAGHACSAVEVLGYHHSGASQLFPRGAMDVGDGMQTYEEYFVLQKLTNWSGAPITIFVCAGTSAAATAAALAKLAGWRSLRDEFGFAPFCVVYAVRTADREMPGTTDARLPPWTVARIWPPER